MKNKVVAFTIIMMTFIFTFILSSCGASPEEELKENLDSGNYDKVVEIYNDSKLENKDSVESTFNKIIDDSVERWSSEIVSYEETQEMLNAFSCIDNYELATKAKDTSAYIKIEHNGNILYEDAEEYYAADEYLKAMESVCEIDKEYSLHDLAKKLYEDAKTVYITQITYPDTLEEYESNLNEISTFLKKYTDDDLLEEKSRFESEYETFKKTIVIIENADNYYSKGQYKKAFNALESGIEKYQNDRHLLKKYDDLSNLYIVTIAQQVKPLVEKEKYDDAIEIITKAQEIYECEEFKQLEDSIKDEKSFIHKWFSAVVDRAIVFASGWKEEVLEVKTDGPVAYVEKSGEKLLLGNYSEKDVTLLSTAGNIGVSLAGFDVPMDIRDLTYDIQNWGEEEYFVLHLATDAIALVPVIGAVKYAKYMKKANLTDDITEVVRKDSLKYAESSTGVVKHYKHVKTINQDLKGKTHPITGVKFVEKYVRYSDGRMLSVVVPEFDYVVQYKLPEKAWLLSRDSHNRTLNNRLLNQIENNNKIREKFTAEQIEDLKNGKTPQGLTWHHTEKEGVMQLVDFEIHNKTNHTGGYDLWGKGSINTINN